MVDRETDVSNQFVNTKIGEIINENMFIVERH